MNRRQVTAAATMAAAAVPFAGTARAQESAMAAADGTIDPAKAPTILNGNFSKVSSQLAVENAANEAVRSFAEREVAEQTAVAMAFSVPTDAPAAISEDKAALYEQLQAASGAEFDRMYVEGQIMGHEKLRPIHAEYAANGTDPMARGASMVGVTGIDSHLAMLRTIQVSLT